MIKKWFLLVVGPLKPPEPLRNKNTSDKGVHIGHLLGQEIHTNVKKAQTPVIINKSGNL